MNFNENMIKNLIAIRKSIIESDAVTDTVWMIDDLMGDDRLETVVDRIDSMLIDLGISDQHCARQAPAFRHGV